MSGSKHSFILGLIGCLFLIGTVWALTPLQATGAPPAQVTVDPRPPVNTPTPPVAPPAEFAGPDTSKRKIDLALIVNKSQARPGDTLKYQLQVSNVAGQKATNVWLTCDLPDEVEITGYTATRGLVHRYGQRLSIEMGMFEPSFESFWVEIKARIKGDVAPGTRLVHRANLTSDQAGGGEREVSTAYGVQVETLVIEGQAVAEKTALPSTGHGTLPFWVVPAFVVLIAMTALLESRARARLSG